MSEPGPATWRYRIEDSESHLTLWIPAEREWGPLVVIPLWLVMWAGAEIASGALLFAALRGLAPPVGFNPSSTVDLLFMAGFLLGGSLLWVCGVYWWLWLLHGCEIVKLGGEHLTLNRKLLGLNRRQKIRLDDVKGMCITRFRRMGPIYGIEFSCERRRVRFARRKNRSDVEPIIAALADRHAGIISSAHGSPPASQQAKGPTG